MGREGQQSLPGENTERGGGADDLNDTERLRPAAL